MNYVRKFDPWQGKQYANGFRVLIVGESQADDTQIAIHKTDTIKFVQEHAIDCVWKLPFFTKVSKLLLGYEQDPTYDQRHALWHKVAFYNYLQQRLSRAREPTTPGMWQEARALFPQVLQELNPNFILVCSQRVRADLPPLPSEVKSICIDHPSAVGWSYNKWAPIVRQALIDAGAPRWPLDLEM